ncbi:MAG: DEAD/DEAH box helicase [Actinobacteria bacterium]|nr:DEAD/DEAH box helicase [Actinomycetota bacterium]
MSTPAEKFAAANRRNKFPLTTEFAQNFSFDFDDFQVQACNSVESGKGVLVAAPTGSGKTVVGEFAAFLALRSGTKCFYTTPIKALSNQKYQEFVDQFGEGNVGLLTGDTSINSEANILVMTTEVLRNMLYAGSTTLHKLGFVVMDEVHYLADKFRGAVWEEVLIHLMESVQVVSLSATVSNAEEFGEWLQEVRGDTDVIVTENRPVPLYQHILIDDAMLDLFVNTGVVNPEILRREREILKRVRTPRHREKSWNPERSRLSRAEIIELLAREGLLPAITFIFSRVGCDAAVKSCLAAGIRLTTPAEREIIRATALSYTKDLAEEDLEVLGFAEWIAGLERGVAAHHAGLLPSFKSAIEDLFQKGLVKAVFATETLALGINMPAKTVVLEKLIKWNGEAHVAITPGEYTQLTGRAGRRGIDIEGNALIQWSPAIDSATAAGLASTRTYPLRSSFTPTYNMSINLIGRFGRERARGSLESSFAQFQADRAVVGLNRQIAKNATALHELQGEGLCHLGNFAEYASIRLEIRETETLLSKRQSKKGFDQKQRAHLEGDLAQLRKNHRNHPCHSCNDRESHARVAEKVARLERENAGLQGRVENRTHVIARTFDRVCDILEELGYIEGERTLAQGAILAKIYAESDLLLTESIRSGILNDLSAPELLSVLSCMIFEARTQETQAPRIPSGKVQETLSDVVKIWARLESLESNHQVKTQREPDFGFCWISFRWANGHSLDSVLKGSDLSVGDFVRSIRQLIDLLNQIATASHTLRPNARDAIKKLDRGVVAYMGSSL